MYYLIAAGVMIISMFLLVFIELKKSLHLLYIIPLTLFFFLGVYFFYDDILGYPTKKTLSKNSLLLSHHIPLDQKKIYIWLLEPGNTEPISIEIPYSSEDHKSLEYGKKMMMSGQKVEASFSTKEEKGEGAGEEATGTDKSLGGMLNIYEMDFSKIYPKN